MIKRVNGDMQRNDDIRMKVNNYLQLDVPYEGQTTVLHYLEVLRDRIGWDAVAAKVQNPLKDKKIGAYYGCLLLRPSREMQFDDPENPTILRISSGLSGPSRSITACATSAAAAIPRSKTAPTPRSRHRKSQTARRRRGRSC